MTLTEPLRSSRCFLDREVEIVRDLEVSFVTEWKRWVMKQSGVPVSKDLLCHAKILELYLQSSRESLTVWVMLVQTDLPF